jgi:hypothetical protein
MRGLSRLEEMYIERGHTIAASFLQQSIRKGFIAMVAHLDALCLPQR